MPDVCPVLVWPVAFFNFTQGWEEGQGHPVTVSDVSGLQRLDQQWRVCLRW